MGKKQQAEIDDLKAANAIYKAYQETVTKRNIALQEEIRQLRQKNFKLDMEVARFKQQIREMIQDSNDAILDDYRSQYDDFNEWVDEEEEAYYGDTVQRSDDDLGTPHSRLCRVEACCGGSGDC